MKETPSQLPLPAFVMNFPFTLDTSNPNNVWMQELSPEDLKINKGAKVEPSLLKADPGQTYQFLRQGYYCKDKESKDDLPVFNRTVGLKDSFAQK